MSNETVPPPPPPPAPVPPPPPAALPPFQPAPPPIVIRPRRSGFGCVGCGCTVLGLIVLVFLVLVGSLVYLTYKTVLSVSSPVSVDIAASTGGEEAAQNAQQKIATFNDDVSNHKASTLQLSGDEINALIAQDPAVIQRDIHVHVTLTDTVRVQASFPSSTGSYGFIRNRFFNIDATCGIAFDPGTKRIELMPKEVLIGDDQLIGGDTSRDQATAAAVSSVVGTVNQGLNDQMRKDPRTSQLLQQAQSIAVVNGQLVIQTQ